MWRSITHAPGDKIQENEARVKAVEEVIIVLDKGTRVVGEKEV